MKVVIKVYHILPEICPKREGKTRKALRKACFIGGDEENRTPRCLFVCEQNVRKIRLFYFVGFRLSTLCGQILPGILPEAFR